MNLEVAWEEPEVKKAKHGALRSSTEQVAQRSSDMATLLGDMVPEGWDGRVV